MVRQLDGITVGGEAHVPGDGEHEALEGPPNEATAKLQETTARAEGSV